MSTGARGSCSRSRTATSRASDIPVRCARTVRATAPRDPSRLGTARGASSSCTFRSRFHPASAANDSSSAPPVLTRCGWSHHSTTRAKARALFRDSLGEMSLLLDEGRSRAIPRHSGSGIRRCSRRMVALVSAGESFRLVREPRLMRRIDKLRLRTPMSR